MTTAESHPFERKKDQPKNYVELTEALKIEKELNAIKDKLVNDNITIEKAKAELKNINDKIQNKQIDQSFKDQISAAFDKLCHNLENNIKNIDAQEAEKFCETEIKTITKLVHNSTNTQLSRLKQSVQNSTSNRPPKVAAGIKESSENLIATVNKASQDSNIIAKTIGRWMGKLMS